MSDRDSWSCLEPLGLWVSDWRDPGLACPLPGQSSMRHYKGLWGRSVQSSDLRLCKAMPAPSKTHLCPRDLRAYTWDNFLHICTCVHCVHMCAHVYIVMIINPSHKDSRGTPVELATEIDFGRRIRVLREDKVGFHVRETRPWKHRGERHSFLCSFVQSLLRV